GARRLPSLFSRRRRDALATSGDHLSFAKKPCAVTLGRSTSTPPVKSIRITHSEVPLFTLEPVGIVAVKCPVPSAELSTNVIGEIWLGRFGSWRKKLASYR